MTESMSNGKAEERGLASLKPFRLMKFFTFSGLAVFLIFTLVLSWVISNHAKKVLLERSEAYALVVAGNLSHQVFQQFVLPTVLRYGKIALRNQQQFGRLDTIVRNTTHGMRIQSVTIYDSKENIVSYSTTPERIGRKGEGGKEYQRALAGENNSVVRSRGNLLNLFPGTKPLSSQMSTFIPFRQYQPFSTNPDMVMGVIEVVQDLSEDVEAIARLQGSIIVTSVLIMSALFTVLGFIVARADRIIEARAQERRKLEQQLHQSQRLATLGEMVASVSHEIKNPLGIVRSTADILGKRLRAVAPGNEHLADIIVDETSRLDGIVREFLDFARPQEPRLAPGSVNELLAKLLDFLEPELEKNSISLEATLAQDLPLVPFDRDMLHRACLNILINGVQAMATGGHLRVATAHDRVSGMVTIAIADSGPGMDREKQAQIFKPFYTDKNRGTGLGLAIVKNIIESHHGTVAVESREGEGTIFIVSLPAE
ncbi:MAG: two-component system sensor histidine kinase NtrB [Thermodesulfobacteriota bacterium]